MSPTRKTPRRGFSLIELVIVVVIIGIIAAIAIPRMSRGTAGAADSAVSGNLTILRNAVELYATEHNGTFPGNTTGVTITDALTQYSAADGTVKATRDASTGHIYGPYLRKIPPIAVGPLKGKPAANAIVDGTSPQTTPTGGWVYDKATGTLKANVPDEIDQTGKAYADY